MATEIERKFLALGTEWRSEKGVAIWQGYLNRDKNRTVRIRVAGERAYLTVKGATHGATCAEFEYEIPVSDAEQLRALCVGPSSRKYAGTSLTAASLGKLMNLVVKTLG